MAFPYHPERIDEAGRHFDEVVRCIQAEEFRVVHPPEPVICKECDLRGLCEADGILPPAEKSLTSPRKPVASEPSANESSPLRADAQRRPVGKTRQ